MGRMFTNTHPATTLTVISATLAQVQSEDKTCDRMAKDDIGIWWEGRGGAGGGGGGGGDTAVVIYFLMSLLVLVM